MAGCRAEEAVPAAADLEDEDFENEPVVIITLKIAREANTTLNRATEVILRLPSFRLPPSLSNFEIVGVFMS
jgi:hypothetical protein